MISSRFKKLGAVLVGVALLGFACSSGIVFWNCVSQCRFYSGLTLPGRLQLPEGDLSDEVIVVLTGDRRRIPKALALLRSRRSPLLIISGAHPSSSLRELVNQQGSASVGIHETWSRIILESRSSSTIQNAIETKKELAGKNVKRLILVTSEYHMYRALQIFRETFPDLVVLPYPVQSDVSALFIDEPLSTRVVSGMGYFLIEYAKNLIYRLYRLPFSNLVYGSMRPKKNLPSDVR